MTSRNGRVRVAVLMGGRSSEHEISLASARSVLEALDPDKYEALTVEIDRQGQWELGTGGQRELPDGRAAETLPVPTGGSVPATLADVDVVFPVLARPVRRGRHGAGAARAGRRALRRRRRRRSALCMDKDLFKSVMRDHDIPVARNVTLREGDAIENPFGYPVFVKPARLGSSVGISKAFSAEELDEAVAARLPPRREGPVEEFVPGSRSSAACSGTAIRSRRSRVRSSHTGSRARTGTTTRPSTTRAGWT
jgi:D-alanine-D-alanine ligase